MLQARGRLVSLEGISGVGKTYLTNKLKTLLPEATVTFVDEASNRTVPRLDRMIVSALTHTNDRFFRTGSPLCETFLILALKLFDYETTIAAALSSGRTVIEDRSIDSVAVYQATLLCKHNPERTIAMAAAIYAVASQWRQAPDITFLIEDDFDIAIGRAEQRSGKPFSEDELMLLRSVADTYAIYSEARADRIVRLDRRKLDEHQVVDTVVRAISSDGSVQ